LVPSSLDVEPRLAAGLCFCRETVAARRSLTTSGPRSRERGISGPVRERLLNGCSAAGAEPGGHCRARCPTDELTLTAQPRKPGPERAELPLLSLRRPRRAAPHRLDAPASPPLCRTHPAPERVEAEPIARAAVAQPDRLAQPPRSGAQGAPQALRRRGPPNARLGAGPQAGVNKVELVCHVPRRLRCLLQPHANNRSIVSLSQNSARTTPASESGIFRVLRAPVVLARSATAMSDVSAPS